MDAVEKIARNAFVQGAMSAAQRFGQKAAPVAQRVFSTMTPSAAMMADKTWKGTAMRGGVGLADMARNYAVGSPLDTFKKTRATLSNGKIDVGGTLKNVYQDHFMPKAHGKGFGRALSYGGKALAVGIPAYQLYNAATGPEEERGGNIGAAMANIAISPISSQFGALGQAALAAPASAVGRFIGNGFKRTPTPPTTSPGQHLLNAAQAPAGQRLPHVQSAGQAFANSPEALGLGWQMNRERDPARGG